MWFFLLSYPILGAGIKYIDAAYDENTCSKKLSLIIAPLLGVLWGYTMFINVFSATILLAVVIGVFATGKIDNRAHIIGMLTVIMIILYLRVEFLLFPLIAFIIAGIVDELGNDFIDKKKTHLNKKRLYHLFAIIFFEHRWTLKVAILGMAIFGFMPWYFFVAMILFDYSYLSVGFYSDIKMGLRRPVNIRNALTSIVLIFK
jgi:hypothetical protein